MFGAPNEEKLKGACLWRGGRGGGCGLESQLLHGPAPMPSFLLIDGHTR